MTEVTQHHAPFKGSPDSFVESLTDREKLSPTTALAELQPLVSNSSASHMEETSWEWILEPSAELATDDNTKSRGEL